MSVFTLLLDRSISEAYTPTDQSVQIFIVYPPHSIYVKFRYNCKESIFLDPTEIVLVMSADFGDRTNKINSERYYSVRHLFCL